MRSLFGCLIGVLLVVPLQGTRAIAETCVGDCNGDDVVLVNELVTAVDIALGAPIDACPNMDCEGPPLTIGIGIGISCLVQAVGNALHGCPTAVPTSPAASGTVPATPTITPTPVVSPPPLECEGCAADGSCSGDLSGVLYEGTCGDGEIINGSCYRVCDWTIPPDVCGGAACNSGRACLMRWNGLVVAGRCQACDCVYSPPPTPTSTATPIGATPARPARTVPPSLQRALDLTCSYFDSEREFEPGESRFTGACYGSKYSFGAVMRQYHTPDAAQQALDAFRDRGIAVPFRGGTALTWTENHESERAVYYVWARGCWLVEVSDGKTLGSGHVISPLRLAEPIYAFALADGLFDQCLQSSDGSDTVAPDRSE